MTIPIQYFVTFLFMFSTFYFNCVSAEVPRGIGQVIAAINGKDINPCRLGGGLENSDQILMSIYGSGDQYLLNSDKRKYCVFNDLDKESYLPECIDSAGIIQCDNFSSTGVVLDIPLECRKPDGSGVEEKKVLMSTAHSYFSHIEATDPKPAEALNNCSFRPGGNQSHAQIPSLIDDGMSLRTFNDFRDKELSLKSKITDYSFNAVPVDWPWLKGYKPLFLTEEQLLEKQNKEHCSLSLVALKSMSRPNKPEIRAISRTTCRVYKTDQGSTVDYGSSLVLVNDCDALPGSSGGGLILTCAEHKYIVGIFQGASEGMPNGHPFDKNTNAGFSRLFDPDILRENLTRYLIDLALQHCYIKGSVSKDVIMSRGFDPNSLRANNNAIDALLGRYTL